MKHFSNAQLAEILEMTHAISKRSSRSSHTGKRPRIRTKEYVPVTSSDNHRAFWINEVRVTHPEKYLLKRAYYKVFGREVYIKKEEITEYEEHGITIYFK